MLLSNKLTLNRPAVSIKANSLATVPGMNKKERVFEATLVINVTRVNRPIGYPEFKGLRVKASAVL
jgi:hypothetical protein